MLLRARKLIALVALPLAQRGLAQTPADTASVQAFYREWFGSNQQGPAAYASFYAPDGSILPPNLPPIRGREAIAEWLRKAQAESPYSTRPDGLSADELRFLSPDWAVNRTTLRGQRVPKAGGDGVRFETKYFDLLHRTAAGRWEVIYRMWSDN